MMHSGTITLSFLPPIAPGLPRKEVQEKTERMIAEEAKRLLTVARGEGGAPGRATRHLGARDPR
jgi:1-acyl-sn-glycerol-3-phosphate acyltransferase